MPRKRKVDPAILRELLAQPEVAPHVVQMTPEEREWYKQLLVSEGIYDRYVKERKRKR